MSWTQPGGAYLEYDLMYRVDAGEVWDPSPRQPSTGWIEVSGAKVRPLSSAATASKAITGLTATSSYVVAVRARDRATGLYGAWGYSGLIEPAGTPGRVSGIGESARSASSLTVGWSKAAGAGGGYEVRAALQAQSPTWATVASVSQPGSGSTVSAVLSGPSLPSGFAVSSTAVVQVRSKSASGTCGSGSVKCSRWVASAPLAQLDITGLAAVKKLAGTDPAHMRESDRAWDLEVSWDEVSAASEYRAQFYWRVGKPSDYYNAADDNTAAGAKPDNWVQDWEWYYDCNDGDASTDPARGCNDPFTGAAPYEKPVWAFGKAVWDADIKTVDPSLHCTGGTCKWTFADQTVAQMTDSVRVWAVVGTGSNAVAGPVSEYLSTAMSPPGTPFDLAIAAPTGASVKLTWTRPYHGSSPITGYDLTLVEMPSRAKTRSVTGTTGTPAPDETSPNRLSYTFHGVPTSRDYVVEVSAVSAVGKGNVNTSPKITLAPTAPAAPAPPTASATASSATLSWSAPADDGGGAVTEYKVQYRAQNADDTWPPTWTAHTRTGTATSTSETVTGLTAETGHQFQIAACNATGTNNGTACSTWSTALTVSTLPMDYDTDDDRLIEISTLAQLNAIRWDTDGNGQVAGSNQSSYRAAFPGATAHPDVTAMGCPSTCKGYELAADLDFDTDGDGSAGAGDDYWNSGSGWDPIDSFNAELDGNGHTISNLFISRDQTNVGLFASVSGSADISDFTLEGVNVTASSATLVPHAGALAGSLASGAQVSGISVSGSVAATNTFGETDEHAGALAGGLVGANSGTISDSHSAASVRTSTASSNANVDSRAGGIAGQNQGSIATSWFSGTAEAHASGSYANSGGIAGTSTAGSIKASYSTGASDESGWGSSCVGGIVGCLRGGTVEAAYAIGPVLRNGSDLTAPSFSYHGVAGIKRAEATVTDSYYDQDRMVNILPQTGHGDGKTTSELQTPTVYGTGNSIYANWNLNLDGVTGGDDPWDFGTASEYPVLRDAPRALTASAVTATTATIAIGNHNGGWWHQGDQTGATCTSVAAGTKTASLASLTAATGYTYTAYSDSACSTEIASATFTTLAS